MDATETEIFREHQRANRLRLRTLVGLRWVAIAGQVVALFVAARLFELQLETGLAAITVGASAVANLLWTFLYPENRRLTEREAPLLLGFDILQLGLLLLLTGGLNNPFAVLLLAPVIIAATLLPLRPAAALLGLGLVIVFVLWRWHLPLRTPAGEAMALPPLFLFGFWLALSIGLIFVSFYARQVTTEAHQMREALVATQLALAREQKLTDLGGVVAATAHELGTPLATIKLAASELADELADRPDLAGDARLVGAQADRCRDILRSMGRVGKDDRHLRRAPVEAVVREAAEPHLDRGIVVEIGCTASAERQPIVWRRPEIVHGLRNLVQNAVDFAQNSVDIEIAWTAESIVVRIEDDGAGFPQSVLGRIGDPFVRRRHAAEDGAKRPGYDGMGLGLFIAKTLLERAGARLSFANAGDSGGAVVLVEWRRAALEPAPDSEGLGLGPNTPIQT